MHAPKDLLSNAVVISSILFYERIESEYIFNDSLASSN